MNDAIKSSDTLAWNGLSLSLPDGWEISAIGKRYLQFDDGRRPVMEIKWEINGASPATESGFKQLEKKIRRASRVRITQAPTPGPWKKSLARFESRCFAWDGPGVSGMGAALYCAKCRTASIVQFYAPQDKKAAKPLLDVQAPVILSTLTDHDPPEALVFRIYDIRARVPKSFTLEKYSFQPGRFSLALDAPGQSLTLARLAPASLIMESTDLEGVARKFFKESLAGDNSMTMAGEDFLSHRSTPHGLWRAPGMALAFKKKPFTALNLRHDRSADRILAVGLKSLKPTDEDLMRWVGEHFLPT